MKKIFSISILYLLLVTNCFSQSGWIKQTIGYNYDYFNIVHFFNQNNGYIISGDAGYPGYYGRFFTTINGGQSWTYTSSSYPDTYGDSYFFNQGNFVLVGNRGLGFGIVAIYTNNIRHDDFISPINGAYMTFLTSSDWINIDTGFISGWDFGPGGGTPRVLKTINNGVNWIEITPPFNLLSQAVYHIKFMNYNTGYCIGDGKLLKTTNSGLNWSIISGGLGNSDFYTVTNDTFYVCGEAGNVRISSDTGHTWNLRPVGYNILLHSFDFINSKTGWVCGDSGYIFKTTNAGINWQNQYSGTKTTLSKIFIIDENNLWIGGDSGIILKTTTGGVTFVNNQQNEIANSYKLYQNYPNPFNPVTKIKFDIKNEIRSQESEVSLKIFDIAGRDIQALVNKNLKPGTYEVNFDAKNLNSGVYFYVLTVDNNKIETRKMLLIK